MWLVMSYPLVALGFVIALLMLAAWLLPRLIRFLRRLIRVLVGSGGERVS